VEPKGNVLPGVHLEVILAPTLSVARGGTQVTNAVLNPELVGNVVLEGQPDITGASESSTVTVKEQLIVFLEVSVARYVTLVTPSKNEELIALFVTTEAKRTLSVNIGGCQLTERA
jgi:hypothetical protein